MIENTLKVKSSTDSGFKEVFLLVDFRLILQKKNQLRNK